MISTRFFGFVPVIAGLISLGQKLLRKTVPSLCPVKLSGVSVFTVNGSSLERLWNIVVVVSRYRWDPKTPGRTVNQIDSFLDYIEFKIACFEEGTVESYSYFLDHFIVVTCITDQVNSPTVLNIKVEFIESETLEVIRTFRMSNLK